MSLLCASDCLLIYFYVIRIGVLANYQESKMNIPYRHTHTTLTYTAEQTNTLTATITYTVPVLISQTSAEQEEA